MTEGSASAYDLIPDVDESTGPAESFEVYHLLKRGKQHIHIGAVQASSPQGAMCLARKVFGDKPVFNVWVIRSADIRFTRPEEKDLWQTLPEKKFRDAAEYRGGDKLKELQDRLKT